MDEFILMPACQKIAGGVSQQTLRRWSRRGIFPRIAKLGPNRVGVLKSELEIWLTTRSGIAPEAKQDSG
jgi:predicted DNA-binding transcriptional regulator AlpA